VWPKVNNQHGGNVKYLILKSTSKIIVFYTKMKDSYVKGSALCRKLY